MGEIEKRGYPKHGQRGNKNHCHRNINFNLFFQTTRFHFYQSPRMHYSCLPAEKKHENIWVKATVMMLVWFRVKGLRLKVLKHQHPNETGISTCR